MATSRFPIRGPRKLHKIGGGYAIFIPLKWFQMHGLDPDEIDFLLIDANRRVIINNPADVEKEYEEFSKEVERKREGK